MDREAKKEIIAKYAKSLDTAIKREKFVRREKENDKITLAYLNQKKEAGEAFDNDIYGGYDEWIETIQKQIKVGDSTLEGIEFKKILLEVVQEYLAKE